MHYAHTWATLQHLTLLVHLQLSKVLLFAIFSSECRKQLITIQICALLLPWRPWKNTHPSTPQRNVTLTWVTVFEGKHFIFFYLITVQGGCNSLHCGFFFTLTHQKMCPRYIFGLLLLSQKKQKKLFSHLCWPKGPDDLIKEEFHINTSLKNHKTQVQLPIQRCG